MVDLLPSWSLREVVAGAPGPARRRVVVRDHGLVPREHSSGATAVRDARWQPVGPGALYKYASGAPAAGLGDRSFAATGRCPRRSRM